MKKVLFVVADTSSKKYTSQGSIQFKHFLLSLINFNLDFRVVTTKTNELFLNEKKINAVGVYKLPFLWIRTFFNKMFGGTLILPDIYRFLINPFLLRRSKQIIKKEDCNIIHTLSFPSSTHLVGLELKRKYNIPWVAQFYDPWISNPYRKIPSWLQKKDEDLERLVVDNADIILHTNENIRSLWIERYGSQIANKIYVMPFNYSPHDYANLLNCEINYNENKEKIIISYIGSISAQRNLNDFLHAVIIFVNKYPNLRNKLLFKFVGSVSLDQIELIKEKCLEDLFEFIGVVPYSEVKKYYEDADVFLVIDRPMEKNIFFPSKIMNYFLYKKPILGITPKNGITYRYLQEYNYLCFDNNDIYAISECLFKIASDYKSILNFDTNILDCFAPNSISSRYINLIDKI